MYRWRLIKLMPVDKNVISGDAGTSFQANYSSTTNQISSLPGFTPSYDNDGNLKTDSAHTYAWNSEARPVSVDSVMITYDALNRIVEQGNGTTFTETVYSPLGAKFALMNGQTLVKAFAPLPDGAIAAYTSTGLAYYRHPDWLGSSRLASTPGRTIYSDAAYAPFGEAYSQTGSTDLSFTAQNQDTVTGLFDFLYREYSPTQGRWVSPDPSGLAAVSLTDPQSWNRYAYVRDSPLVFVDPNGLFLCVVEGLGTIDVADKKTCEELGGGPPPDDPDPVPGPCDLIGTCSGPGGNPPGIPGGGPTGPPNPCQATILNAVNNQFGTNFTDANVQSTFNNGGAVNLVINGTGLPPSQFNAIQPGRSPSNFLGAITGYGPSLHITGQAPLDPTAVFNNSNDGGATSVTFTAHIDSAWADNPIGALLHFFIDVLGSKTRNPCP
jgi:RHS repeat-associated protein